MLGCDKVARRRHFCFPEIVSSPKIKNISLFPKAKSVAYLWPSRPTQRGVGHRHERGTGRGGRGVRKTRRVSRTVKSCGPDARMLASSSEEANASEGRRWQQSLGSPGRARYKP